MTPRERVLSAMKRQPVDRLPLMFRGIPCFTRRLMDSLGVGDPEDSHRVLNSHRDLMLRLGGVDYWTLGSASYFANYVPRFIGDEDHYPFIDHDYYAIFGIEMVEVHVEKYDYTYAAVCKNPLSDCENVKEVEGFLTRKLDLFDYKNSVNFLLNNGKCSLYHGSESASQLLEYESQKKEGAVISTGNSGANPFMICCYLRGMENFFVDLVANRKMAEAIVSEVKDFVLEFNRRSLENSRVRADVFASWDDVCMQSGMMFSMDDFERHFLPIWHELISLVKSHDMLFCWHCCGNVNEVLPSMIEAGIDVFDVLQSSASGMGIREFYGRFGRQVCVQGGIDVQHLLVDGTPAQIEDEVRTARGLWADRGGIVLGPSHEVLPETPLENLMAIYR